MTKPDYAAQKAALSELVEYDHAFLDPEGVEHFTKPFGFVGTTYMAQDSRDELKGLRLPSGPGTQARGQDADEVAVQICKHLGAPYRSMFGRGSRLRECCQAALAFIERKEREGKFDGE